MTAQCFIFVTMQRETLLQFLELRKSIRFINVVSSLTNDLRIEHSFRVWSFNAYNLV